jgi:tripartite-type tricarboxylate transporter receptor subunit TctC
MLGISACHSGRARERAIRNPDAKSEFASGFRVRGFAAPRNDRPRGRVSTLALALALLAAIASPALAQSDYPNRAITLVVPLPPGGTNDIMARAVADKLSAALGQQVVVENRAAGGNGTVGTRQVAKGPADGYTILLGYTSTLATSPHMLNVGYEPTKDFATIGLIGMAPSLLLVHPSAPYKTVADLLVDIRASKEPFQVGTPGISTVNHLSALLFAHQAKVSLQYIPYKGSQPLSTDLVAGHVKVGFNPIPVSRASIEGKLLRALAATSLKRSAIYPDLPTIAESGLPGYDAVLTYGLVAAAATPRPIIDKLNRALRSALDTDEVKRRLHQEGAETMPTTPEQHMAVIVSENAKWSALIKANNLGSH